MFKCEINEYVSFTFKYYQCGYESFTFFTETKGSNRIVRGKENKKGFGIGSQSLAIC